MLTILLVLLCLVAFPAFGNAIILWGIARLLKVPRPLINSAFVVASIYPVIAIVVVFGLYVSYERSAGIAWSVVLIGTIASIILPLSAIRYFFAAKWGKSVAVYVSWGICGTLFNLGVAIVVQTLALQAFVVPTSAMAPTIVGVHRLGICPHCGGSVLVSTPLNENGRPMMDNAQGICAACWKFGEAREIESEILSGDRIIMIRQVPPKRWNVVTYYPPAAPNVLYVHRIVGMPGESVLVKNGHIWIDGTVQSPPAGLEKLMYAGSVEMEEQAGMSFGLEWGVGEQPCQLADDECFVLGDNTLISSDSRFFGPVKMARISGVVTMRYWPPSRIAGL